MVKRAVAIPVPGAVLARELRERDWTQTKLARVLGLSTTYVNDLIQGHRGFSPLVALRLEAALGTPAVFWMDLQRDADLAAEKRDPHLVDELAAIRGRAGR